MCRNDSFSCFTLNHFTSKSFVASKHYTCETLVIFKWKIAGKGWILAGEKIAKYFTGWKCVHKLFQQVCLYFATVTLRKNNTLDSTITDFVRAEVCARNCLQCHFISDLQDAYKDSMCFVAKCAFCFDISFTTNC